MERWRVERRAWTLARDLFVKWAAEIAGGQLLAHACQPLDHVSARVRTAASTASLG